MALVHPPNIAGEMLAFAKRVPGCQVPARNPSVYDVDVNVKKSLGTTIAIKTLTGLALFNAPMHKVKDMTSGMAWSLLRDTQNNKSNVRANVFQMEDVFDDSFKEITPKPAPKRAREPEPETDAAADDAEPAADTQEKAAAAKRPRGKATTEAA